MGRLVLPLLALALIGAACGAKTPSIPASNSSNGTLVNESTNTGATNGSGTVVPTNSTPTVNTNAALRTAIVKITPSGVSPAQLRVVPGTVVAFVNEDSVGHEVASDPHPSHTALPGFDAGSAIAPGGTYTFTFTAVGTWSYHDHLDPFNTGLKGSVIVSSS